MVEALPGAGPFPEVLARRLAEAVAARSRAQAPRTHHLVDGRPRYTNRLALERSPYLLQHAHNPVSWYPWGDEAFEEARRRGKPVFLSVGYSTCHWCHVMERESFEDEEIARVLNERYVAIKVDREERPDVDAIYMTAVQLLTGGGGWPMSVWLTPDREPFFGGTYFPPRDGVRGATRGFLGILEEVADVYARDRPRISAATGSLVSAVRTALASHGAAADEPPGPGPIEEAVALFRRTFDETHGGVRRAPKFPSNLPVRLLLRYHRRTGDPEPLHMALLTLEKMAAGGIHDQVGGGFHRYSTDAAWLVPHFEKMLYDNALLAVAYAEAWQVTGRRDLARVVRGTLDYLVREMTSPEGGLWSATDADSEGEEGRFFVWEERELRDALGPDADRFAAFHGVTPEGNFEGRNILWVPRPDEGEWEALAPAREKLYALRARRVPPLRDEKVLAGWNGLAISALAFGGRVLGERRYVEAAARAADFVLGRMVKDGRLQRTWVAGEAAVPAFLEDHAFVAQGLLELFEATFEPRWLAAAVDLSDRLERLFGDPEGGGWFTTAADHERLLAREKPTHDGAEPSGASVAVLNALRLDAFTTEPRWRRAADAALRHYHAALEAQPAALTELLLALDFATDSVREVVLLWPDGAPAPEPFLDVLRRTFLPSRALAGAAEGDAAARLGAVASIAAGKTTAGGRPTAYVCERGACRLPAIAPEKLAAQIAPVRPYR
ncbi:thioredoxin domain-containing protein [Anaeromyxobacter oryzae]|uniref:Thioredoxin domain-containing protein n=1 Tax=Anaeromyxobacter oryzae TaxID=2918170 RepID=A0ABM7WYX0_9BACT|nr:thioredoxin domain-containing protein [Anaeromyxobacter oryzae]BDG04685.1 thioredoxin domain-containing protein [Anaeromyxobacter oryzae]